VIAARPAAAAAPPDAGGGFICTCRSAPPSAPTATSPARPRTTGTCGPDGGAIAAEFALRASAGAKPARGRWDLRSVYVGGGTPSCLEPELLAEMLAATAGRWPASPAREVTPRPTGELRAGGRDRLARGGGEPGQPRDPEPRRPGPDGAGAVPRRRLGPRRARAGARSSAGGRRLAARPACGGPPARRPARGGGRRRGGTSRSTWSKVHTGTPLAAALAAGTARLPDERASTGAYLAAAELLETAGLRQYEVANFARPGEESRHNAAYWRGVPYLGWGRARTASGRRRRYANSRRFRPTSRRWRRGGCRSRRSTGWTGGRAGSSA